VRRVAIDTETTGLNVWTGCRPFAVSMMYEDGEWLYWEWDVAPFTREPIIPAADLDEIREITTDPELVKCFFNLKFDFLMLRAINVAVTGVMAEVSFMARAVNNLEHVFALKPLAKKYVGIDDDDAEDLRDTVKRCRRAAKKLGWKIATKKEHGDKPINADYWLPGTLVRREPKLAAELGVDLAVCETYAVRDVERTIVLDAYYRAAMEELDANDPRLLKDPAFELDPHFQPLEVQATYEREMKLMPDTIGMEAHGVAVDGPRLQELVVECTQKRDEANARLRELSGLEAFNHNAPRQVAALLFEPQRNAAGDLVLPKKVCQHLKIFARTKTGMPKTDAEALMPYRQNKVVDALLTARANDKALSTFFEKYLDLAVVDVAGELILHPGFEQWGALTGRYTCRSPNLQQVSNPKTTNSRMAEFVVDVRQAFIPRPGCVWYCPDYSQLEVIIFADIANEQTMLQAIKDGADIHTATTNKIWGGLNNPKAVAAALRSSELAGMPSTESQVIQNLDIVDCDIVEFEREIGTKLWRKLAKTVTFTKIFGGGPRALMSWIGCSHDEAVKILADYDEAFPDMTTLMQELMGMGRKHGFVVNRYGRKLNIDPWRAYTAVNYLVQSSAADLMKAGMRKCARYLRETGLDARILMTIHDELIFEFRRGHNFKSVLRTLCSLMADHEGRFSVPTQVDLDKVTTRWSEKIGVNLAA